MLSFFYDMIILFGGANNRIAIMMNALQNILIRKVWSVGLWNIMQGTYIVVVETSGFDRQKHR